MSSQPPSSVAQPSAPTNHLDVRSLVAREGPRLLDYFARRVSNREDAADLLGDTLVVVWRRAGSIPPDEEQARMWLYGVARKVLSGHRRTSDRRTALTHRLRQTISEAPASEASHLGDLIAQLPPADQEIIGLVYWEGFSLVEVAQVMSLRPATVRSRHARAREKLRVTLEASDELQATP